MGAACGRVTASSAVSEAADAEDSDSESDESFATRRAAAQSSAAASLVPLRGASEAGGAAQPSGEPAPGCAADAPDTGARHDGSARAAAASPAEELRLSWQRGELLGVGAFGRVFLGLNEDTGELLAVKEVLLSGSTMEKAAEQLRGLEAEVSLLRTLSHPNIVRYLGTERTPQARVRPARCTARVPRRCAAWAVKRPVGRGATWRSRTSFKSGPHSQPVPAAQALHIFLEFVPGGSIASLLGKFGAFAERVVAVYTRQILEGLDYLHRHQIMHRDIKGANILVDNAGCVKLADFGASRQLADLVTIESGHKSIKGTPYWMAPEVIKQTGHGRQADIWSVGCTVVEMTTAKPPWSEFTTPMSAMFHIASAKAPPPLPGSVSPECRDFMLLCFNRVPKERPNATRLLRHPFVAGAGLGDGAFKGAQGGGAAGGTPATALRRAFSAIPEGVSPSISPSTGPRTGGGARYTPVTADALSSLGSEASPGGEEEARALESLRRRLQLSGDGDGGASAGSGGGSAEGGFGSLSLSFNPMEEPSWSPPQSLPAEPAPPPSPPQTRALELDPVPSASPVLPGGCAEAPAGAEEEEEAARGGGGGGGPPLSFRLSDETIASTLAREEQERAAAQEAARLELRRSKQAQWEEELQRELEAQRAHTRQQQQQTAGGAASLPGRANSAAAGSLLRASGAATRRPTSS